MTDDTIHIHLRSDVTDTHMVGTYSVHIWAHLLAVVNWIYKNPIPGHITTQHGISMTLINNAAIALEGFIADICWEYVQNKPNLKPVMSDIDGMTWRGKRDVYNKLFQKKLDEYYGYDGMVQLINFRNNLAHGRTYEEFTQREISSGTHSPIETDNKVYQNLRDYLISKKILVSQNISSNVEVPWKIEAANHFVGLAKHFMENVLRENESDNKMHIQAIFKHALGRQ